ncbi:MAG: hypothetical protein HY096_08700 [Nitrospinae bacterium]|nr:hypothetical protein [Nitrospinota bacterium]
MWWNYGLDESDSDIEKPESVSNVIGYFKVNELKNFIKERNIKLKPAPKTRAELELRFKEVVSWEDFKPTAIKRYEELIEKEESDKEDNLCRLLSHTLTMTTYSLVRYYQIQELLQNSIHRYIIRISSAGDLIKDEFAEKYNRGEIKDLPPYFPGDRNGITTELVIEGG